MIRDTFGIHQLAIPVYVMCLHGTYLHEKKKCTKTFIFGGKRLFVPALSCVCWWDCLAFSYWPESKWWQTIKRKTSHWFRWRTIDDKHNKQPCSVVNAGLTTCELRVVSICRCICSVLMLCWKGLCTRVLIKCCFLLIVLMNLTELFQISPCNTSQSCGKSNRQTTSCL